MNPDISLQVAAAKARIDPYIRTTPLEYTPVLSEITGSNVYLKLENLQITGSFKARGAVNKVLQQPPSENNIMVTASTGNHAEAVSYALEQRGFQGVIFLPENTSEVKTKKLTYYSNISLQFYGNDSVETEKKAREWADEKGFPYISPYNDMEIIAGQGTIGLEVMDQADSNVPDAVFVPVGGGGLISGIAGYMKFKQPEIAVIGCQPENSAVMYASVKAGKILDIPSLPTISDGTAGGVEKDAITFEFCSGLVDQWVLVTEDEIKYALKLFIKNHNMIVEGAASLGLAALLKEKAKYRGKNVVLIVCGNKLSPDLLKELVCES